MPRRPTDRTTRVTLDSDELRAVLRSVETAYEAAWHLADRGRLDFGPFEGLPRALRILRAKRDQAPA